MTEQLGIKICYSVILLFCYSVIQLFLIDFVSLRKIIQHIHAL